MYLSRSPSITLKELRHFLSMTELDHLIHNCLKKDKRAEYALYKHCFNMLMRICYRYTVNEDDAASLMNTGFLKILTHLDKYDHTRSFESWAKTIMVNTILDEYRSSKKRKALFADYDMTELSTALHPVDVNEAEHNMGIEEIVAEIDKLPEACKLVFNLHVFDGLSHKEISETTGLPEGTSRWHLSNARNLLKARLGKLLNTMKVLVL